jgi:hypothetical protein
MSKQRPRRSFASDNNAGAHPEMIEAVRAANEGHVIAYGDDEITARAVKVFKKHFGKNVAVYFVFGGTGANVLGLKAVTKPYQAVICAETAHINVDECGAPEKFTGCKLISLPTPDGKLRIEQLELAAQHAEIGGGIASGRARDVDDVDEDARAFEVPEEPVAESRAFMGAFDQSGNVRHHEGALAGEADHAEIGHERGEGVVGDARPGRGDARDERGLSHVGISEEPHVREQLELEANVAFLAGGSGL